MADWHISALSSLINDKILKLSIMKKETNEVYIVNQPKKSILSIIFVGKNEYPFSESIHNRLYDLSEISDLFFIFHNGGNHGINEDKFCNLYSGCGWTISSSCLPETFLKIGKYSINIFKSHTGFLILNSVYNVPNIKDIENNILSINSGGLVEPIFKERRLTSDEFYKIYNNPGDIGSILSRTSKLDKKYSIWTSDSDIIFLRPDTFNRLETLGSEYFESFSWTDIRYFIASGIKRLMIGNTNCDIKDLEIGKL